jgi:hypothetical protein
MGTPNVESYIKDLLKYRHLGSNIGKTIHILAEFSSTPYLSTYKLFTKSNIAYKNVREHVKRLEQLGYIEPVLLGDGHLGDLVHGAKYYRISEAGMFQLFLQHDLVPPTLLPKILEYFRNYSIFETLVYPYFKRETMTALKELWEAEWIDSFTIQIGTAMCDYLHNCCMEILQFMNKPYVSRDFIRAIYRQERIPNREEKLEDLYADLTELKTDLVMKILLWFDTAMDRPDLVLGGDRDPKTVMRFRTSQRKEGKDIYTIMAQDNSFIDNANDLKKDIKRNLDIILQLRKRRAFFKE